jgi:hypothetical protein
MSACRNCESELSALLDGESDARTAVTVLDHLTHCESCQDFYQRLRHLQGIIDRMPQQAASSLSAALTRSCDTDDPIPSSHPRARIRSLPEWAWAVAAVLIVAVGLLGITQLGMLSSRPASQSAQTLTIRLEENKGQMSGDRFVELVTELLQADRQYQFKMLDILTAIPPGNAMAEAPALFASMHREGARQEHPGEWLATAKGTRILN